MLAHADFPSLSRLRNKSFRRPEEDKLKHVLHEQSMTYGPMWGKLQLAQGLFPQPAKLRCRLFPAEPCSPGRGQPTECPSSLVPDWARKPHAVALRPALARGGGAPASATATKIVDWANLIVTTFSSLLGPMDGPASGQPARGRKHTEPLVLGPCYTHELAVETASLREAPITARCLQCQPPACWGSTGVSTSTTKLLLTNLRVDSNHGFH